MWLFSRRKPKVFCIGRNKTGTTSIAAALKSFGYRVANDKDHDFYIADWYRGDFQPLIDFCRRYNAFQDTPFSLPNTYRAMDQAFPGSKFILTVRNSAQEWYDSLIRYHTKLVRKNRVPTPEDLQEYLHRKKYKGWLFQSQMMVHGIDPSQLYDPRIYMKHYDDHNRAIWDYFSSRPNDLLTLNLNDPDSMRKLCEFLGMRFKGQQMPHLNRTRETPAPE